MREPARKLSRPTASWRKRLTGSPVVRRAARFAGQPVATATEPRRSRPPNTAAGGDLQPPPRSRFDFIDDALWQARGSGVKAIVKMTIVVVRRRAESADLLWWAGASCVNELFRLDLDGPLRGPRVFPQILITAAGGAKSQNYSILRPLFCAAPSRHVCRRSGEPR